MKELFKSDFKTKSDWLNWLGLRDFLISEIGGDVSDGLWLSGGDDCEVRAYANYRGSGVTNIEIRKIIYSYSEEDGEGCIEEDLDSFEYEEGREFELLDFLKTYRV